MTASTKSREITGMGLREKVRQREIEMTLMPWMTRTRGQAGKNGGGNRENGRHG